MDKKREKFMNGDPAIHADIKNRVILYYGFIKKDLQSDLKSFQEEVMQYPEFQAMIALCLKGDRVYLLG